MQNNEGRISIYTIALSGLFLAVLSVSKYMDLALPRINGYSAVELYWVVGILIVITLPWIPSLLVLAIAPFVWFALGQLSFVSPFSIFLDYMIPLFCVLLTKIAKSWWQLIPLIIIAAFVKWMSLSLSGSIFYEVEYKASMVFNAPFAWIPAAIALGVAPALMPSLSKLRTQISSEKDRW